MNPERAGNEIILCKEPAKVANPEGAENEATSTKENTDNTEFESAETDDPQKAEMGGKSQRGRRQKPLEY